jgi:CTP:molybdopterin cytidylyltransferase MocA
MNPALDPSKLPPIAQKILSPGAPAPMRMGAARGLVPGLKPADLVAVVAALSESDDQAVADTARATLRALPPPVLTGALTSGLEAGVIDLVARAYTGNDDVLVKLIAMPAATTETVAYLAATGSERVCEQVATNEARLLAEPVLIEKLYMNRNTRMSTADRIIDLASRNGVEVNGIPAFREACEALKDELIAEPTGEPTMDDLDFAEAEHLAQEVEAEIARHGADVVEEDAEGVEAPVAKALPLHAKLAEMSISGRIRRAQLGTGAERQLLLRDTNKLVATAAIRSPMIQEQDVERISKMRTVHDEVLRVIATKGQWLENHTIKFNLVANPRTPLAFATKFIAHLRLDELKRLEKNRDVPANVRGVVRQQIQRKAKSKT